VSSEQVGNRGSCLHCMVKVVEGGIARLKTSRTSMEKFERKLDQIVAKSSLRIAVCLSQNPVNKFSRREIALGMEHRLWMLNTVHRWANESNTKVAAGSVQILFNLWFSRSLKIEHSIYLICQKNELMKRQH
jgi:hypothetical protein